MRITESQLRRVIREVIKEAAESDLELYDSLNRGYIPNIKKIGAAYFQHVHQGGQDKPEEWAEKNLNMRSYDSAQTRNEVMKKLEDAYNSPAHSMPSGR